MNRRGFIASMAGASVVKPEAEATVSYKAILRAKDELSAAYRPVATWQTQIDPREIARVFAIPVHVIADA